MDEFKKVVAKERPNLIHILVEPLIYGAWLLRVFINYQISCCFNQVLIKI